MTDQMLHGAVSKVSPARQGEAFQKKLDLLFSQTYHECIEAFPTWIQGENRTYIHPEIEDVWQGEDRKALRHTSYVDFEMRKKKYRITQEFRMGQGENDFHIYKLYLDGDLVFAVSESYRVENGITLYTVFSVDAFENEDWVEDFKSIKSYYDQKISGDEKVAVAEEVEITEEQRTFVAQTPRAYQPGKPSAPKFTEPFVPAQNQLLLMLFLIIVLALLLGLI